MSLKLNFYNNIEQRHPVRPNYEISVSLESMSVTISDHIFHTLMRLKDVVMDKLTPPPLLPTAVPNKDDGTKIELQIENVKEEVKKGGENEMVFEEEDIDEQENYMD